MDMGGGGGGGFIGIMEKKMETTIYGLVFRIVSRGLCWGSSFWETRILSLERQKHCKQGATVVYHSTIICRFRVLSVMQQFKCQAYPFW